NPGANGEVLAMGLLSGGGTIFAGGDFASVGGVARRRLAALSLSSGQATSWNPGADTTVACLALSGGILYAGGAFTQIAGQSGGHLAALDPVTGIATAWNPSAGGTVNTILPYEGTLYVGGGFASLAGQPRSGLGQLDPRLGSVATAWNPALTSGSVRSMTVLGGLVYACGSMLVNGESRPCAAFDATTGWPSGWSPYMPSGAG